MARPYYEVPMFVIRLSDPGSGPQFLSKNTTDSGRHGWCCSLETAAVFPSEDEAQRRLLFLVMHGLWVPGGSRIDIPKAKFTL